MPLCSLVTGTSVSGEHMPSVEDYIVPNKHKHSALVPALTQGNPVHTQFRYNPHPSVIFPFIYVSCRWSVLFRFSDKCCMPSQNILLILKFSKSSCYFVSVWSKYSLRTWSQISSIYFPYIYTISKRNLFVLSGNGQESVCSNSTEHCVKPRCKDPCLEIIHYYRYRIFFLECSFSLC